MTGAATHRPVLVAAINVAERLRPLRDATVSELAASMSEVGLINPISITYPNGRASPFLVAGVHRLEAARRLKWETIDCTIIDGKNVDATKLVEIDENLIRADLTPAERSIHIAERKRIYEALHPETKKGGDRRSKSQLGTLKGTAFVDDTAAKTDKSRTAVARDATRAKHIPRIADCIGTSLDEGEELDALAKLPQEAQGKLIARAANGEKVSAKPEAKRAKRAAMEQRLAKQTLAASEQIGHRLYGVIYIDPPWQFEPYSRVTGMDRAADNHYPTMTQDELTELVIPAAPDCVLFCWVTVPMLPAGMAFLSDHGFTYRTSYFWLKPGPGTGYWSTKDQIEILLVATQGKVPAPAPGDQPPQTLTLPRGEHSAKPDQFAAMIAAMFPNVPKLEMFARKQREGWDPWGNQAA
jgi:N6-adenosine-specific RNA methylase IME4